MDRFDRDARRDQVALRVGALHLARQRGDLRVSAWAAARLRLRGVRLEPDDAHFAHDALVRLGQAIRLAGARRDHETGHELPRITYPVERVRSHRWLAAAIAMVAVALVALLVVHSLPGGLETLRKGGAPAAAGIARPEGSPLRGRSQLAVPPLVTVVRATGVPEPREVPDVVPNGPATNAALGGSGAGGGGTGSGSGAGSGLATPTADPGTVMLLSITVTDARLRVGIPGVCVIDGLTTCENAVTTDQNGNALLRLSRGQLWHLEFKRSGYFTEHADVLSDASQKAIAIVLQPAS